MNRPHRRRTEIKTASKIMGRTKVTERHVHQFQIACLELERTRRLNELTQATQRVADINARLAEIEKEMGAHAAAMPKLPVVEPAQNVQRASSPGPAAITPAHREASSKEAHRAEGKRRTLRY